MSGRTTHHSLEERLKAVLLYLSGQVGSSRLAKQYGVYECCDRYNISSHSVLRGWLKRYTSGKTFTEKSGGSTRMKAKRKVTQAEREETER